MSTINELLKQHYPRHHKTSQNSHATEKQIIKNHLQKIKQLITSDLKTHQMEMMRCNKKLNFYFMFKTEVNKSEYSELIKNMNHRKALAKLRSGNYNLRIESGYLKSYIYVSTVLPTKLNMKFISFYIVIIFKILGNN